MKFLKISHTETELLCAQEIISCPNGMHYLGIVFDSVYEFDGIIHDATEAISANFLLVINKASHKLFFVLTPFIQNATNYFHGKVVVLWVIQNELFSTVEKVL